LFEVSSEFFAFALLGQLIASGFGHAWYYRRTLIWQIAFIYFTVSPDAAADMKFICSVGFILFSYDSCDCISKTQTSM
jgi:hypothetical protein